MRDDDLASAPALGLYLALTWIAIASLPKALITTGLLEWWEAVTDAKEAIRNRRK